MSDKADAFIIANARLFPAEHREAVRRRLADRGDDAVQAAAILDYRDPTTALVLSLFLGGFGIDRFYLGHIGLGIGKLLTLGGLGIWSFIDWFLIMGAARRVNLEMFEERLDPASPAVPPRRGLRTGALVAIAIGGFLGMLAVIFGVVFTLVVTLSSGATDAADAFLDHVGNGRYEAAYRSATPQFRTQTDFARFRAVMQRYGVDRFASSSWNSWQIRNRRATIGGSIALRGGGRVAVTVDLVKVGETWRVHYMRFGPAGTGGAR